MFIGVWVVRMMIQDHIEMRQRWQTRRGDSDYMPPIYLSKLSNCLLPEERRNLICCCDNCRVNLQLGIQNRKVCMTLKARTHNILDVAVSLDLLPGENSGLASGCRVLNLASFAEDVSIQR